MALCEIFEAGLLPSISGALYKLQVMPTSLVSWKMEAQRQDIHRLKQNHKKQAEKYTAEKPILPKQNVWNKSVPTTSPSTPALQTTPIQKPTSGMVYPGNGQPMDIDTAKCLGICFNCGHHGHLNKDCPTPRTYKYQVRATDVWGVYTQEQKEEMARLYEEAKKKKDF